MPLAAMSIRFAQESEPPESRLKLHIIKSRYVDFLIELSRRVPIFSRMSNHAELLLKALRERIVIIDGAMGTTIRTYGLGEKEIRGERFKDSKKDLKNNGDLYSLTQPATICDIHRRFLEAGADIIETNTFSATSIGQSEFFVDDPRERGGRKDPAFYQGVIAVHEGSN